MRKFYSGNASHKDAVRQPVNPKKKFLSLPEKILGLLFPIILFFVTANVYCTSYKVISYAYNAREKSITLDCQQDFYFAERSSHWQLDQIFLFTRSAYYNGYPLILPSDLQEDEKIYQWSDCGISTAYNSYAIPDISTYTVADDPTYNPSSATWYKFKWYNVPASLNGKTLNYTVDNDADANDNCSGWNNTYTISTINLYDYFYITPSVDYTASADNPNYVKINYTIDNNNHANENATYTVVLYNGNNVEVGRSTTASTSGSFYVPVSDASKDETFTLKASTSLNVDGKTINHNFQNTVTVAKSAAPTIGTPTLDPCNGAIKIGFSGSGFGTVLERCENSSFSGATLISINAGTAWNYTDNQELTSGKTYYYRARRWGSVYSSTVSVKADFTPAKPPVPAISTVPTGLKLNWSYTCNNVKNFIIMRKEKGQGGEISLAEIPSTQQSYSDLDASSCTLYAYRIIAENDQNVQSSGDLSDYTYYNLDISNALSNLKVAKGYSPSKTSISWTCTGLLDEFVILRKVYGSSDAPTQILSLDAKTSTSSGSSRDYEIDDQTGDPGVVYEYTVRGMLSCAGNNQQSNDLKGIGFRSPTGNVYGRITFSGGQAVQNVDVIASSEDVASKSNSFYFNGTSAYLKACDPENSFADSAFTVQAWIRPNTANLANQTIFYKPGKYELGFDTQGNLFFADANNRVSFNYGGFNTSAFTHVTGVREANKLKLYANDSLLTSVDVPANSVVVNNDSIFIGRNASGNYFNGYLDEVLLWNKALSKIVIARDYTRLLAGNEKLLAAYWRFDEPVVNEFYDISYQNSVYNEHHGKVYNAVRSSSVIPTSEQLMLKGITDDQGNYMISGISYLGDGTIYTFRPRCGIHSFDPVSVNRLISASNSSYVLDFTDNSSFPIRVDVKYKNSTYPVKGVGFKIDGVAVVLSDGTPATTNDIGEVTLSVPIGQHTVQAYLANHTFEGNGFITTPTGADRNYQSAGTASLEDITKVHVIGRMAGGAVQQAIPLGFSQSKNNLGDHAAVKIELAGNKYNITNTSGTIDTITQYRPKIADAGFITKTNTVAYNDRYVTVYPNKETGEFSVDLIPVNFNVTSATVDGYGNIISQNIPLDLSAVFQKESSILNTKDSVINSQGIKVACTISDTVLYNADLNIIHRENPSVSVTQMTRGGKPMTYFGNNKIVSPTLSGVNDTIAVFDEASKSYKFDNRPVFLQGQKYYMQVSVFESYKYNNDKNGKEDRVPSEDGTVEINNAMNAEGATSSLDIDSLGHVLYTFTAGDPNLTTGIKTFDIAAKVDNGTYLWSINNPFIANPANPGAFLIGTKSTGTNFVTAGPNEIMMVIRDPHGSGSSAFVQQGSVINKSTTISASTTQNFDYKTTASFGTKVVTWVGIGAGTITEAETIADASLSVSSSVSDVYSGTQEETITTNTNFSTSSEGGSNIQNGYVGHDGDLFVGNSTNISYGVCNNVSLVKKKNVASTDIKLWGYDTAGDDDYVLVSQKSIAGQKNFGTLFAYPLYYIENTLIPNLKKLRNSILESSNGLSAGEAQAKANTTGKQVYVSKLKSGDNGYGETNTSTYWGSAASTNDKYYDGPSYTIYFPAGCTTQNDTILILNQAVAGWEKQLANNEQAKIEAQLEKNYSISAGSSVSLSKQVDKTTTATDEYSIVIGGGIGVEAGGEALGIGLKFDMNLTTSVTTGGNVSTGNTQSYTTGFTLSDDNGYLSEDVCTAADGSYVFKLKGGATMCPYEGAYSSSYYKPGTIIDQPSMQMEVPKISVKGNSILTGIPSNKKGSFQLQLDNESESGDDVNYILKIDEASNPDGATFYLDGSPIGDGRNLLVRYGEPLLKTLEVGKGAKAMDYNNLRLILESQCEMNIADTVNISVSFVPSCSDIVLEFPLNKWVVNTNTGETEATQILPISVKAYDVNQSNLNNIDLEYKPSSASESAWTTIQSYFIDSAAYKASPLQPSFKQILPAGGIKYDFKTYNLDNQLYDIRAKSVCKIGATDVISYTDVASGVKDAIRPRLFGSALPANGILTVNDEIRLNFSEDIADGLLSKSDFQVRGIINGSKGDHSVSLYFDGINDYVYTEAEKNMTGKSLTFEAWVKRDKLGKATLFGQGNINNDFEFGFNANNQLEARIGAKTVTSTASYTDTVNWQHVAVVFDANKETASIYQNFKTAVDAQAVSAYSGDGNMEFGRSLASGDGYLKGRMHEVRVWNRVVSAADLQINSLSLLSGGELGLMGYWPMSESKGTLAVDKAGGANGILSGASWYINPRGKALTLSGNKSSLKLETGSVVIKPDMEYTLEMWFKGGPQQNATLVSNGRGDGKDYDFNGTGTGSRDLLWIGFNENGELAVRNNGYESTVSGDFLDNNWHQLAFAVNRRGNAQILVDGELKNYFASSNLGGFAAANLYLGERSYRDQNGNAVQDMYFKGSVDEFRIWKLYLNQTLINNHNNVRLNGDEIGLMAYYPFDKYITYQGENFLQFTPNDLCAGSVAAAPVLTAAAESDDIAPIKGIGPVQTLDFDFVVNKDALIINLLQDRADVEKTIVTFTVDNVQDLNGNKIASPITWSAYIDRNQLKWEDSELSLSKAADEELTFSEKINNTSGSVQNYSIENLPTWLTVSDASGTIQPNSSVTVTFTVDPALNIGAYDQVIYLRNSDNVVEALNLTVKVKGENPNWTVNPKDYKYNMSVYAKLRINNIFSKDKEDMISAFMNGKCVGVANVQYEKRNDMWYAFLTVYGNQTVQDGLTFRIWDASTGKTYLADAGSVISFVNDGIIGTPAAPAVFDAKDMVYQNISLSQGWNWISFDVKSDALNSLNSVLANMSWNSSNFFKSEADNISANYSDSQAKWIPEKEFTLNNSLMYKVSSSSSQQINLAGSQVTPSSNPLTIKAKQWNYISYIPSVRLTLDEALAGYSAQDKDVIKSQTGFAMYANNIGWVGNLSYLEPNKGYMLYRTASDDASFKYPDNSGSMSAKKATLVTSENSTYVSTHYSDNMSLVAIPDIETLDGDKILAYSNGDLLSSTTAKNVSGKYLYFITVGGNKNVPVSFMLERGGKVIAKTGGIIDYSSNMVLGSVPDPVLLKFTAEEGNVEIYPNPVADLLHISLPAEDGSIIKLSIVDVLGHELWKNETVSDGNGLFQTQINCSTYKPGIYLLQISVDGKIIIRKITKQ